MSVITSFTITGTISLSSCLKYSLAQLIEVSFLINLRIDQRIRPFRNQAISGIGFTDKFSFTKAA